MRDSRIIELADILVNYSLEVGKGEHILIRADEPEAMPLMEEIYKKILGKGAYPFTRIQPEIFNYLLVKCANKDQIENFLNTEIYELKKVQGRIKICAPRNPKIMTNIDPEKYALLRKRLGEYLRYLKNIKWTFFYCPTEGLAQQMNMSLGEAEDFIFKACLKNWKKEIKRLEEIKEIFDQGGEVGIEGRLTEIGFSIKGRKGEISDGKHNMPGGEVYYAPIENSIDGQIFFEGVRFYEGKEMEDIFLRFTDGELKEVKAKKGEDFLKFLIKADKGAGKVGEFGIGCNYDIDRITNVNILDEKIGGTIHLALGDAISADGKNRSTIHFDIVKDLRKEGKIYLDGELVQKNGKFLF